MTMTDLRDRPLPASVSAAEVATPRVVVAVDIRPVSFDALAWAADEALCRGMSLRIVTAFADPGSLHAARTVEQAMYIQRRLRRRVEQSRPWLEEAEFVVRRGSVVSLLAEASNQGDIVVIGEGPDFAAMDPVSLPVCAIVVVPAQRAAPADGSRRAQSKESPGRPPMPALANYPAVIGTVAVTRP